jgi:hypothetical protein
MWNFQDLRTYLLPLVENVLGDVEKIRSAREFGIQEWLVPAHVNLCQRPEPLTTKEATKLGVHSLLIISRIREQSQPRALALSAGHWYCDSCSGGFSSSGNAYGCAMCGMYGARVYYGGPTQSQGGLTSTEIETQVKKWVDDGCILVE